MAVLATGMTAAGVAFVAGCLAGLLPSIVLYLFITSILCVLVAQYYPECFFSAFIVNVFAILSGTMQESLAGNMDRLVLIIIGVMVAAVFQVLFYPHFVRNELRSSIIITLKKLKRVNHEIFSCLLQPEYPDNIYLFERRLHIQKNRFMQSMMRLRAVMQQVMKKMNAEEKEGYLAFLVQLDLLYANMLDYSQIRRRVTDHTSFLLCAIELSEIVKEVNTSIDGAISHVDGKKYYVNADMLAIKIKRLDDNYQNVLQIAVKEPLVFMLFIDSLNAFSKRIKELYGLTV
ncbi:MAG: hypothetical protein KIT56_04415 [Gammaproteobacteria bacterium]|nr:hypothetical protein [Gammaproteobacteria bacterium]